MKQKSLPTQQASDIYTRVTERIIELLEQGVRPWSPSHIARTGFPRNFATGKPYRGINVFLLGMRRYASPWWLTFIQAKQLGGNVRRGEKASLIVKYGEFEKEEENAAGELAAKKRGYLKGYYVFNAHQLENITFPDSPDPAEVRVSEQAAEAANCRCNAKPARHNRRPPQRSFLHPGH